MKILRTALAGMTLATAAVAQTTPEPQTAPPTEAPAVTETPAPMAEPAPAATPDTTALVMRDGKWWKGDREATKKEIAENKRSQPR